MPQQNFYNSHNYIKMLIEKKIMPNQAEAIVNILMNIRENDHKHFASKNDLFNEIVSIKYELSKLELRMIIKLGAMIISSIAAIKFFL